ncbi:hypothetical protein GCM10027050_10360 [Psychrosphaera aestuarii]
MNMKILLLLSLSLLLVSLAAQAQRIRQCASPELEYIRVQMSVSELNRFELPEKQIRYRSLKYSEVCEDRNEIVMDGLVFTLYILESEQNNFIDVYNGLDGSRMLYGPFER